MEDKTRKRASQSSSPPEGTMKSSNIPFESPVESPVGSLASNNGHIGKKQRINSPSLQLTPPVSPAVSPASSIETSPNISTKHFERKNKVFFLGHPLDGSFTIIVRT